MKISFSTLACPDYEWSDIYSMAKDLGFDGIEIRGLGDDIFAVKARPFTEGQISKTVKKLSEIGIEIPCLSSGCCLKDKGNLDEVISEISSYINLAVKLKTPFIRILGDREPMPVDEVDDSYVAEVLGKLADIAKDKGVTLLVETNGVYADTKRLKALLDKVDRIEIAALWDMHHPYRYANENPDETVENLGAYIKYCHVKDSVMVDGKAEYKLMGEGDMPLSEMFEALGKIGYEGYISLEWVKRWAKNIFSAGVVFPQYADFMKPYRTKHNHP